MEKGIKTKRKKERLDYKEKISKMGRKAEGLKEKHKDKTKIKDMQEMKINREAKR
jgi:hypothetical protein